MNWTSLNHFLNDVFKAHRAKYFGFFIFLLHFGVSVTSTPAQATKSIDCYIVKECLSGNGGGGNGGAPSPSTGGKIRVNPSAVPTEKGYGIEGIFYDNEVDLALVKGLGRVGAGISPSNSEDTFFGPPGFEFVEETFERKQNKKKYPNQKVTLATAAELVERRGSGLKTFGLKLGLMAKYNTKSKGWNGGGGLNMIVGPFSLGASQYSDETMLAEFFGGEEKLIAKYKVQTLNAGISLNSLLLDYSVMKMHTEDDELFATVNHITAGLIWKRLILTVAQRTEDSERLAYNYEKNIMETQQVKQDYFGGLQVRVFDPFSVGLYYNYYLLREFSVSATLFF